MAGERVHSCNFTARTCQSIHLWINLLPQEETRRSGNFHHESESRLKWTEETVKMRSSIEADEEDVRVVCRQLCVWGNGQVITDQQKHLVTESVVCN